MRRRPSLPVPVQALVELASDADTAERASETIGTETALALIATLPPREAEAVLLRAVIGLDAGIRRPGAGPPGRRRADRRPPGLRRLAALLERQTPGRVVGRGRGGATAARGRRPSPAGTARRAGGRLT